MSKDKQVKDWQIVTKRQRPTIFDASVSFLKMNKHIPVEIWEEITDKNWTQFEMFKSRGILGYSMRVNPNYRYVDGRRFLTHKQGDK